MSTLYDPLERDKLEWAVGAILTGDSRYSKSSHNVVWFCREVVNQHS